MKIPGGFLAVRRPEGLVSLRPGVVPETAVETILAERLGQGERVKFTALVDWLARRMLAEHRGDPASWVLDIGLWGPWLFRREAARALRKLQGRLLEIGEGSLEAPKRPTSGRADCARPGPGPGRIS